MQIGDNYIELKSGEKVILKDIDFGWYKFGIKGRPQTDKWIEGEEKALENYKFDSAWGK